MVDDIQIDEATGTGLAAIMARRGVGVEQLGRVLGVDAPIGPCWTASHEVALIGTGPGAWLAVRDAAPVQWADDLRKSLVGLASVSDQSSAYTLWRLSGPGARTLLQRGAAIDLHPESFGVGSAATTMIAHVGVIIRQLDDTPRYELAAFRSYADSLRQWLDQAVAALPPGGNQ